MPIGCIVVFITEPVSKFLPALQRAFFAECLTPFLFDQSFLERIILRFEGDLFPADCNSDDAHGLRNLQRPSSHRSLSYQ